MKRLALIFCLLPSLASATTLYLKTAGGNWGQPATWSNTGAGGVDSSGPPTLADDAIAELLSGDVQVTVSTHVARSFSATAGTGDWTGTLTHSTNATWTIVSTLTFSAGMTYTRGSQTASTISFLGNSSTIGAIDFAGKNISNVNFGGLGAVYNVVSNMAATNTSQTIGFTSSTVHLDGSLDNLGLSHTFGVMASNNSNSRGFFLGNSSITVTGTGTAWNFATSSNLTFQAGGSTITLTGSGAGFNHGNSAGAAGTYNAVTFRGGGNSVLTLPSASPSITIASFTYVGTASKLDSLSITSGRNVVITKELVLLGNSAVNRPATFAATIGSISTFTVTGATVTVASMDFRDIGITPGRDLSAIVGLSGDCGVNPGIIFTTPATQTYSGTASLTWSDTPSWTSRVPLCQDDVVVNGAFISGRAITLDMPRLGKTIDMSAATWAGTAPTLTNSVSNSMLGSLLLSTNGGTGSMLWSGNSGFQFQGRSAYTLTSGGLAMATSVSINAPGGTIAQQDNFTVSGLPLTISIGTWDANDFNLTASVYTLTNAVGAVAQMGSGVWTGTSTGSPWNMGGASFSVNSETSTIFFSNTTSIAKNFVGLNKTYYDLRIANSTGAGDTTISGNNSFHDITVGAPKTVRITAASTQTITGNLYTNSVSGSSVTFASSTAALGFLVASTPNARRQCLDWINIGTLRVTPAVGVWYAGDNSSTVGSPENWSFTSCYKQSNFFMFM